MSFAVPEDAEQELLPETKNELNEMVTELRRLSPVSKSSRSPIAGLGLDINSSYVPAKKEKPKAVQKSSPKVRHRRKSALKKSSTVGETSSEGPQAGEPAASVEMEAEEGENELGEFPSRAPGRQGATSAEGKKVRRKKKNQQGQSGAAKPRDRGPGAAPRSADDDDEDDDSEYEFDFDNGSGKLMGTGKEEKEAYSRHIPLEPLKELEPLHKIIPLEEILMENELEDQMMVSTREFDATVKLFKVS